MMLRQCLAGIAFLCAGVLTGHTQSFGNQEVEGLCIYKTRSSLPNTVATLFEYRTAVGYPNAAYIFPVAGPRFRVPPGAEFHCIPYPGRGDLDKKTAQALLEFGRKRFPQYEKILRTIESAWRKSAEKPGVADETTQRRYAQSLANISQTKKKETQTPETPEKPADPDAGQQNRAPNPAEPDPSEKANLAEMLQRILP